MEDTWEEKEEETERQIMRKRERKRPSKYFYRGERIMLAGRRVTQKEERGRGENGERKRGGEKEKEREGQRKGGEKWEGRKRGKEAIVLGREFDILFMKCGAFGKQRRGVM